MNLKAPALAALNAGDAPITKRWPCIVIALLCSLLTIATSASALCVPLMAYPQPDINSPIKFMEAMIDSLAYLRIAGTSVKDGASTVEMFVGLATRKDAYKCASDLLSRFTSSTNSSVAHISKTGSGIYATLVEITERLELLIKNYANSPDKPGDFLSALGKYQHDRHEMEMHLVSLSAGSNYAIVQFGPGGEATGSLNIRLYAPPLPAYLCDRSSTKGYPARRHPEIARPCVDYDHADICASRRRGNGRRSPEAVTMNWGEAVRAIVHVNSNSLLPACLAQTQSNIKQESPRRDEGWCERCGSE
jgi:hypothetical protein